jgi:hypothetical protein
VSDALPAEFAEPVVVDAEVAGDLQAVLSPDSSGLAVRPHDGKD